MVKDLSDSDVLERKEEIAQTTKKMENLGSKFPELHRLVASGTSDDKLIDNWQKEYSILTVKMKEYFSQVQNEGNARELQKKQMFDEKNLNIKLQKFKGYASIMDIYSFQSEFEKLYVRTTPNKLLPELLKNNFLEDSALTMVKYLDDIEEIWKRLKKAFGDTRVMMNKKFTEISTIEGQLRSRDSRKGGYWIKKGGQHNGRSGKLGREARHKAETVPW